MQYNVSIYGTLPIRENDKIALIDDIRIFEFQIVKNIGNFLGLTLTVINA